MCLDYQFMIHPILNLDNQIKTETKIVYLCI